MPSLSELQRAFTAATVFDDRAALLACGVVAHTGSTASRIAVYRNNVFGNYRNALAATYPVIKRLVGDSFFNAALDIFARDCPATSGDLNRFGGDFAAFLGAYRPARELAYLPDVAHLEWAVDQANLAADAPSLDLEALSAVPPEALSELHMTLHPAARVLASPFPILRIWQVNQFSFDGDQAVDLGAGGVRLLVKRAPSAAGGVSIETLGEGEFRLLHALSTNRALSAATASAEEGDASFDLGKALREHVASRTIVGFHIPQLPLQEQDA